MTRFSSDILLPFPNSNDLNSRDIIANFHQVNDGLLNFSRYLPIMHLLVRITLLLASDITVIDSSNVFCFIPAINDTYYSRIFSHQAVSSE